MKKNIRRSIDIALTLAGVAIIFSAILTGNSVGLQFQLLQGLVGVLLMEAGVWALSSKIVPSGRKYTGLREEGDKMLVLIRELHTAAIAKDRGTEDAKRFQLTLETMHTSVERMSELAAQADDA